jgi:hypothetical protein
MEIMIRCRVGITAQRLRLALTPSRSPQPTHSQSAIIHEGMLSAFLSIATWKPSSAARPDYASTEVMDLIITMRGECHNKA